MRLTKSIRNAFIQAALDDVPSEDYETQIRKLALDDAKAQMPTHVAKAYKEYPEYFNNTGLWTENVGYFSGPWGNNKMRPETAQKIKKLQELNGAQTRLRIELEQKLRGVAYSVNTRKALAEALPEFEKYLPSPELPLSRQVPVLANVLSEFVKAGWPKQNKDKIAKAQTLVAA